MAKVEITVTIKDDSENVVETQTQLFQLDEDMEVYGDIDHQNMIILGVGGRPKSRQNPS